MQHPTISLQLLKNSHCLTAVIVILFIFSLFITQLGAKTTKAVELPQKNSPQTSTGLTDLTKVSPQPATTQKKKGKSLPFFTEVNFASSGRCAVCHRAGQDREIANNWRSTMMANAARDPMFLAKVASEVARNPHIKQVIEEKCVTCHMPMAWTQKNAAPEKYAHVDEAGIFDYFLDTSSSLHKAAMDGVSCSACHQIQPDNLGTAQSFSGNYIIDTTITSADRPIFGPNLKPSDSAMISVVGFTPVYGAHIKDAALCATCHNLYTPFVDHAGEVVGEFPEQTIHLEWLHSAYSKADASGKVQTCQSCHMPRLKEKDAAPHNFVGGNIVMSNVFQDNIDSLGVTASSTHLTNTRNRTLKQLQSDSASLSLIDVKQQDGELTATVAITSKVGHKFPSGFPTRRLWIHLTVEDSNGAMIFESGKPLADGSIYGDNLDAGKGFEPHHTLISSSDQVQIYEAVMSNTRGEVTHTLINAATYLKDNRLLPQGFDKKTAHPDFAVYGKALTDQNFTDIGDHVTYKINTGTHQGPFTVTARLFYHSVSAAFINDLRLDDSLELVSSFLNYFDKTDKIPTTVAVIRQTMVQ